MSVGKLEGDIVDLANAIEAAFVNLKQRIVERRGITKDGEDIPVVSEENFDLTYTKHTGAKLGEFQIADEKDSPSDLYQRALNILKNANATISSRYHGENYTHSFWLYNSRIYRQKLKK